MSNSSDSKNFHHSDSEELSEGNSPKNKKDMSSVLAGDFAPDKETEAVQCVESELNSDVDTTGGVMETPMTVETTSLESENLPQQQPSQMEYIKKVHFSPSYDVKFFNTMGSRHVITYELEKFKKNAMIIFNQENMDRYDRRDGTEKDVEALQQTFTRYGFEVQEQTDKTVAEVFRELTAFTSKDFSDYGCVCVAILTNGTKNGLLRAYDGWYHERRIIDCFDKRKNPTLWGKPVIILIQASRDDNMAMMGYHEDEPQPVELATMGHNHPSALTLDDDEVDYDRHYDLPTEADMVIVHSSSVGKASIREVDKGSWFIQALCNQIQLLADDEDFESICTAVRREVAAKEGKLRAKDRLVTAKQLPVVTSTLIRALYLRKYQGNDLEDKTSLKEDFAGKKDSADKKKSTDKDESADKNESTDKEDDENTEGSGKYYQKKSKL